MRLDAATLETLAEGYGDAFYLVDLAAFEANYAEFLTAFRDRYPATNVAYSYKTNYTPRLCELVADWGGYAEVVSRMEYELALRVGMPDRRIVFNGPLKTRDDLALALSGGAIVNLDSPYQLDDVVELASGWPKRSIRVGLRVTFPLPSGDRSRFGFEPEELPGCLDRLRALPAVEAHGLHCHFLTPGRSAADYRGIADRMLAIVDEHYRDGELRFLNLGGGYLSRMSDELRRQLSLEVPSFADYAEAIAGPVAARFRDAGGPELLLEPGIALTADVARFVTRVLDVRAIGSRRLALVAGSVYDLKPTLHDRNLPMEVVDCHGSPGVEGAIDVVGSSCMEDDVLFSGFTGSISKGDRLVFENAGAYTNVLRPPFIRGCPPILGWNRATGDFELLKRAETMSQTLDAYLFSGEDAQAAG